MLLQKYVSIEILMQLRAFFYKNPCPGWRSGIAVRFRVYNDFLHIVI